MVDVRGVMNIQQDGMILKMGVDVQYVLKKDKEV